MNSLSNESIDFLRRVKGLKKGVEKDPKWRLHYTKLFCELFEIVQFANASLHQMDLGKWSISYDGEDSENDLSFTFSIGASPDSSLPKIKICIKPYGASLIEVAPVDITFSNKQIQGKLTNFYKSPAYKRYFAGHSDTSSGLKTIIPTKQITSRHFGSYLQHLLKMVRPYFLAVGEAQRTALQAA